MRFGWTADQVALREAVRDLLASACPPSVVRAAWPGGDESSVEALWSALTGMGIPGAVGELGLDEVDLVSLLEETGYAAVPLPVVETAAVAAPLLAATGDPGGHLPGILAGRTRVAVAGGLVPYGRRATLVLHLDGPAAWLSTLDGAVDETTVDGSLAAVRVPKPSGEPLTEDAELVGLAADRLALGAAAQLVGLGRRMLDLTVGYVRERRQFGVPVGSFQAVKHHLADALVRLEFAAPAVYAAAWALAGRRPERGRDVSTAVLLATEAAREAARTAIQCHGAIGYTVEYDLHLYAKRAWAVAATCDTDAHLARVAEALDLKGAAA
ncbi:acyl-CoA dehydrogenase [Phytohabitans sp. ZYX-F-186]|uniref:Acyl-CoA dehydrogenase n=1 Tax=Phytohabitans maris TaxID=3071409 RepID=A0ABU0Z9P0_9ACTN|nr:acyl-CoA dehydrogenase [Phytohabitans sp. ZYX-F-186]MDQ7903749.1 acyl-CoA dehydrogenase [Phytohabitans sp. ZYX-F-186]